MQVIRANPNIKSFGQRLNEGIGSGLETLQQYQKMAQEQAKQQRFADEVKKLYGIDVSSMSQEGMEKLATEAYKQKAKLGQFEEKVNIFNKLRGRKPESQGVSEDQEEALPSQEDEELAYMIDPKLGEYLERTRTKAEDRKFKEKEKERKEFVEERDFHSKYTDPILKESESVLKAAGTKRGFHEQLKRDILSGNTSGFMQALVDSTGFEPFRNPESARFKGAVKNRFVESIKSLGTGGARPNQFIEKQLASAQETLGRDIESNYTIALMESFKDEMDEAYAKFINEEAGKDIEAKGYAKRSIVDRAQKRMDKFAEQKQDELAYDIRKFHEDQIDDSKLTQEVLMGVPNDTPLTIRAARILMLKNANDERKAQAEAKKLGFRIPKESTYQRG